MLEPCAAPVEIVKIGTSTLTKVDQVSSLCYCENYNNQICFHFRIEILTET